MASSTSRQGRAKHGWTHSNTKLLGLSFNQFEKIENMCRDPPIMLKRFNGFRNSMRINSGGFGHCCHGTDIWKKWSGWVGQHPHIQICKNHQETRLQVWPPTINNQQRLNCLGKWNVQSVEARTCLDPAGICRLADRSWSRSNCGKRRMDWDVWYPRLDEALVQRLR